MGIQVPPDSTGKVVETNSPDGSTQRQVITVGDKTTAANTLAISGTGAASVSVANSSLPVTGTFFQSTQPVSGTVSVSNFPATQPVSGTVGVSNASIPVTQATGTNLHVVVDSAPTTAVTGTFFQATQPVSGTVAVSNFPASQAVTGTFFQGTQPVSGTVTITAPTLTKGTQGATGLSVQNLLDAGRTYVTLRATLIAGVTTEALATFTKNVNGTDTAAQTAYTITSGKTFRIQSLSVQINNTTTVANSTLYNVRVAASVSASSPTVLTCGAAAVAAIATVREFRSLSVPDGIDIPGNGSIQIGVSHLENVTTAAISSFLLNGFEY